MSSSNVLVVGGGLAGLSCARHLHAVGAEVTVLEAADRVGGRVRTDPVDGFLLDRGFQVLLTAYPECRRQLDYAALDLCAFTPGARVRYEGRFHTVADPMRMPLTGLAGVLTPIGTLADKLRVARLKHRLAGADLEAIFARAETTTQAALEHEGFSTSMIECFFRPFLGGIFLEDRLETSSRMFEFVFKMFSSGDTVLPAHGMQAIPDQLAAALPATAVRTGERVVGLEPGKIGLESGEQLQADAIVVAATSPEIECLVPSMPPTRWCGTTCYYYDAPEPPFRQPTLMLDGEGRGPINNLCVPSQVAPTLAPAGRSLVSASVIGAAETPGRGFGELEAAARAQMRDWFGVVVDDWRLIRSYRIPRALPRQLPGVLEPPRRPVRSDDGLYLCGDHRDSASLQGAMVSGRRAAEAVLSDLGSA